MGIPKDALNACLWDGFPYKILGANSCQARESLSEQIALLNSKTVISVIFFFMRHKQEGYSEMKIWYSLYFWKFLWFSKYTLILDS